MLSSNRAWAGTYETDPALELNQADWFMAHYPTKFGMGACPTCTQFAAQSSAEILFRKSSLH